MTASTPRPSPVSSSRLADAHVDSITALGSTGSYAYLNRAERRETIELAVAAAGDIPVFAGIGAVRTRDVLAHAQDAQNAGAAALMLAPVSYQRLTDDEVYALFQDVAAASNVPVIVYDNPGTTGFTFTDDLHARIAALDPVAAIKIPPVAGGYPAIQARVTRPAREDPGRRGHRDQRGRRRRRRAERRLRRLVQRARRDTSRPLPQHRQRHSERRHRATATGMSDWLQPLWDIFATYGSYRVVSAIAETLGLVSSSEPAPTRARPEPGRPGPSRHRSGTSCRSRSWRNPQKLMPPSLQPIQTVLARPQINRRSAHDVLSIHLQTRHLRR